jgi:hypothetical protein
MHKLLLSVLPAMALMGCTPDLNWRQTGFEGTNFKTELPCKPDRTTRQVPLGGLPVDLQVAGCESGSAMVAVMTAALPPGTDANAVLQGWQQATLANMVAQEPQRQAWVRSGMLPLPAAQRVNAQGLRADGQTVNAQAVWSAFVEGNHVRLVHAAVYDRKAPTELADTLFESLKP